MVASSKAGSYLTTILQHIAHTLGHLQGAECIATIAIAYGIADNTYFRRLPYFDLEPVVATAAGVVFAVFALGHNTFKTMLTRGVVERIAIGHIVAETIRTIRPEGITKPGLAL